MNKVTEFINAAHVFYLGTVDNGKPEVRPIGVFKEYDGKFYTAVGEHKNVYAQMIAEPRVVLCALGDKGNWIRMRAVVVKAGEDIVERVFADAPFLHTLYNSENGRKLGVFELTQCEVEWCGMGGPEKTEKL